MDMLRKLEDVITFGKHKGKTVEDVYFEDAKYLSWLINNTDKTNFRKFLLKNIELAAFLENQGGFQENDPLDIGFDPHWD